MHLEMKTQCEKCGTALEADGEAYICSYECTYCSVCASGLLGVCCNCGGELIRRPRRTILSADSEDAALIVQGSQRPWLISEAAYGPALNSVGIAQACEQMGHKAVFLTAVDMAGTYTSYGFPEFIVKMAPPIITSCSYIASSICIEPKEK